MAARKMLFHPDVVREKIRVSQLLNRLDLHANGEVDLSPTQIKAIEILLKKAMPDLSAVDLRGSVEVHDHNRLSDAELAALAIADRSTRTPETAGDPSKLN
jgi:hypothetical protein